MPLVKNKREERLWEKAKDIAAEQGHTENYAYIMGIFKKMLPDRFPAKTAMNGFQGWSRGDVEALTALQEASGKHPKEDGVPLISLRVPTRSLWRLVHVHEVAEYVGNDRIKLNSYGWMDTSKLARAEQHKPGDVWRTDNGKWRAIPRGEGDAKSFDDKDQASAYAKGKGKDQGSSKPSAAKMLEPYEKVLTKLRNDSSVSKKDREAFGELDEALVSLQGSGAKKQDLETAHKVVDKILKGEIDAGFFKGKWKKLKSILDEGGKHMTASKSPPRGARLRHLNVRALQKYKQRGNPIENDRCGEVDGTTYCGDEFEYYEALVASIQRGGVKKPLELASWSGRIQLVEGHHRLSAAWEAGLREVPVYVDSGISDEVLVKTGLMEESQMGKEAAMMKRVASQWVSKEADSTHLYKAFKAEIQNGKITSYMSTADLNELKKVALRDLLSRISETDTLLFELKSDSEMLRTKDGVYRMSPSVHVTLRKLATELAAILEDVGKLES